MELKLTAAACSIDMLILRWSYPVAGLIFAARIGLSVDCV